MTIEFLSLAEGSLAYQRQVGNKNSPGVFFLSGFASDMEGTKPSFLSQRCAAEVIPFIRFDYRGCGRSTGNFADGTIGGWLEDSLAVFDQLTEGPQIVVGSSMGGWLGLLLTQARPERIKALIGIAAAPDFTEDLVWEKLTPTKREDVLRTGVFEQGKAAEDSRPPITLRLIEEARAHLVLRRPLPLTCPVRLLQGMQDQEVPWTHATRLAEHIAQDDVHITFIKNGDHRLSTPQDLELLWDTIGEFVPPSRA